MANGVPFDVAFKVDEVQRMAWCIVLNENKTGRKYNFMTKRFEEPEGNK